MCISNRIGRRIQPQAEALALNSVALIILPSDLIAYFHQAISDLNTELIPTPIAQIHKINEPIAKALASLTKTDQFEQLLALTKSRAS